MMGALRFTSPAFPPQIANPSGALGVRLFAGMAACVTGMQAVAPHATPVTRIIHNRLAYPEPNWQHHTIRSGVESLVFLGGVALARFALEGMGGPVALSAAALLTGGMLALLACAGAELGLQALDGPPTPEHEVNTDPTMIWREEEGKSVLVPALHLRKGGSTPLRTDITMAEVARHNKREDAWIVIEGQAYDVTDYIDSHPGGWLPIVDLAGKDVTDAFANYHPARVYAKMLPMYHIGSVVDYTVSDFVSEHRALRQELLRTNQFESKWSYYGYLVAWLAILLGTALYLSLGCTSTTAHMAGAAFLAFFWQQGALLGHDVGHNSLTHVRDVDQAVGVGVLNPLLGVSMAWWKRSHNVHHVVCNSIENDPDIQHMPIIAVDKGIFGSFWSTYHQRQVITDAVARALVSIQHIIFFPAMAFGRFNLYAQFIMLLSSSEKVFAKRAEVASLLTFAAAFTALSFATTSTWGEWWAYTLLSHGLTGVLHVQIVISHFAEEVYHGMAYNDDGDEWFTMQVRTSLNVLCPTWMDWFHGGLQFQTEHHLYPRLPRHNLRVAREKVMALCTKYDIPYKELPFFPCIARVITKMAETAAVARTLEKGDGGFYECALHHGMNAIG